MSFWIRGKLTVRNYFAFMMMFTCLLLAVVTASYFIPSDRTNTTILVAFLSVLSMGSSLKVLLEIQRKQKNM